MDVIIRRSGSDLIVEVTALGVLGTGINVLTSGTGAVSIQRMSDANYWNSGTTAFDLVAEPALDSLVYVRDGLHEFVLTGATHTNEEAYRIHITVTGNPGVNIDGTFSDVIPGNADSSLANQVEILARIGAVNDLGSGDDIFNNLLDIFNRAGDIETDTGEIQLHHRYKDGFVYLDPFVTS